MLEQEHTARSANDEHAGQHILNYLRPDPIEMTTPPKAFLLGKIRPAREARRPNFHSRKEKRFTYNANAPDTFGGITAGQNIPLVNLVRNKLHSMTGAVKRMKRVPDRCTDEKTCVSKVLSSNHQKGVVVELIPTYHLEGRTSNNPLQSYFEAKNKCEPHPKNTHQKNLDPR